jgi:Cdc6-like AAA superfamily ATPase
MSEEGYSNNASEVSELLYRVLELHESVMQHVDFDDDTDARQTFIEALRYLAIHVAGADGQIRPEEADALSEIFWQDPTEMNFDFALEYESENPEFIETMLVGMESHIAIHAQVLTSLTGKLYKASNDSLIEVISAVCQCVLAADSPTASEVARLSKITSRLREKAISVEKEIAIKHGEEPKIDSAQGPSGISAPLKEQASLEETLAELHRLVGLDAIKQEVEGLANLAKVFSIRKSKGLPVPDMSFHLIFLGNPGTGKTTVARLISQIYGKLGLLSSGHLVEVDRSGLVANYVGQTATKVQEVINKARGGVLFIDEAYSLVSRGESDFGQEAIETLLKAMEDNRSDLIVIAAGYTDEMREFLSSNPGLRSRFSRDLVFTDYTPDEMVEIFRRMADKASYRINPDAEEVLASSLQELWDNRDNNFANARDVRNYFERAISNQANRLGRSGSFREEDLCILHAEDLEGASA